MKIKKVLFIIPQNTSGGAERVMAQLVDGFSSEGIEVTLANFDTESNFYPISRSVKWVKMGLEFNAEVKWKKILEAPIKEFKRFCFINRLIKETKPDIVIPFLEMAEVLTIPNCILTRTPFCVSVRNDYQAYFGYMKLLSRLTYGKAKLIVCQTKPVMETLLEAVKCNTTVISNPLDKEAYIEAAPVERRRDVIINVGRLTAQKNQRLLIDAFAQIADEFPTVELHIFGKGELKEDLSRRIAEKGLEGRVKLQGVIPNALANNRDAKLFVMSSDFEGFPNTLVEAMANEIPVISTDFATKAASEILNNGEYGTLVPVGDTAAMAEAIRSVLHDYAAAEVKAHKGTYIREKLDSRHICREWIKQLEAVL